MGVANYYLRRFKMRRILKTQTGVTLTELLVVLAVIAVSSAIAVPLFLVNLPHKRLKSAALDLITDMRLTRSLAVSNNTPYFLCFTGDSQYQIDEVEDPTTAVDCNSDNTPTEKNVDLTTQYLGVQFGYVAGLQSCPDKASGIDKAFYFPKPGTLYRATFNSRGASMTGTTGGAGILTSGIVYLTNTRDPDQETFCIQIEGTTGRAKLYQWNDSTSTWE
jgi:prepilin-type N-terminal cleavage/methylation domain-containing protein